MMFFKQRVFTCFSPVFGSKPPDGFVDQGSDHTTNVSHQSDPGKASSSHRSPVCAIRYPLSDKSLGPEQNAQVQDNSNKFQCFVTDVCDRLAQICRMPKSIAEFAKRPRWWFHGCFFGKPNKITNEVKSSFVIEHLVLFVSCVARRTVSFSTGFWDSRWLGDLRIHCSHSIQETMIPRGTPMLNNYTDKRLGPHPALPPHHPWYIFIVFRCC